MFVMLPALCFGGLTDKQMNRVKQYTPAPVYVADNQSITKMAEVEGEKIGGDWFYGRGNSMYPYYPANTAIVTKPIKYDDIKKGMTLVYRKRNGNLVAHVVIGEDGRGYIVQGVNNNEPDVESVNEKNLVGVVVKAYTKMS